MKEAVNPSVEIPRTVIILRGASSSGKSAFAELLTAFHPDSAICSADEYFYLQGKGTYAFDPEGLFKAHNFCYRLFTEAIAKDVQLIVVANTNTTEKEWNRYHEYAIRHGYKVTFVVLERRHDNYNAHGVPLETLQKQDQRLRNNLKLM